MTLEKKTKIRIVAIFLTLLVLGLGAAEAFFITLILWGSQFVDCSDCLTRHGWIPVTIIVASLAAGASSARLIKNPQLSKLWLLPSILVFMATIINFMGVSR